MRRFLILGSVLILLATAVVGADKKTKDTPAAAAMRKKLKQKVSVDYDENTELKDVVADLSEKVDGLHIHLDNAGGVSNNLKIKKYKAEKKALEDILADICKQKALGYLVISKKGAAYDGDVQIKQGTERGFAAGDEPAKMDAKDKDEGDDEKPAKDKTKGKDKSAKKDKAESKDKDKEKPKESSDDDPDKAEKDADRLLSFAKTLIEDGKVERAKTRLKDLVAKYPKTKAAESAQQLLKDLDK